ncbi:MAG: dephospho-CoA kinase [Lachnospiraceae bacterium]|nr:dephospho-CoA kinase [Lachnospiraceae bacterium]
MKKIGVTGGVGAGKSTVLNYLRDMYDAQIVLADLVGHEVMESGQEAYEQIVEQFGQEIVGADSYIDRKNLGALVFADPEKLRILNGIVHPAVKKEILRRIEQARKNGKACVVVEAALFLEENYDAFCDETWYIYTNEELRRERLRVSRGYSDERIDQIIAVQKRHEEFLERCQFVIDNNGTEADTHRQIDRRMRQ